MNSLRNLWWFGACDASTVSDFLRRSALILEMGPGAPDRDPAREARFEHEIAIGDLVLVYDGDRDRVLFGEVDGAPIRRLGLYCMLGVRSMIWRGETAVGGLDPALAAAAPVSPLSPIAATAVGELLAAAEADADAPEHGDAAAGDASRGESPDIEVKPEPLLPILYQSPYAERILRDFRWREYLHANPDVAATGDGEAHALHHFFYQGYYERRIFDAKRLDGFDPEYYRARYPELGLADDGEAMIHYCYQGYYEQRVPNRDTGWLYDADLHVFQMGKVGSHTIAGALLNAGYDGRIMQLHWVTDIVSGYPSCRLPYSVLLTHPRARPLKVISAAREIVSWALSGLFQSHGDEVVNATDAVAMAEERFWERCRDGLRWFDHRYFCDLDVYAHPFDHSAGWSRIGHAGLDLLLYRQEDLPRLEAPLAAFMDLPELVFAARNEGSGKRYAELYAGLLRDFRVPGNLLASLYDSPFMRHFYSDAERERAYARWVRRERRSAPLGRILTGCSEGAGRSMPFGTLDTTRGHVLQM